MLSRVNRGIGFAIFFLVYGFLWFVALVISFDILRDATWGLRFWLFIAVIFLMPLIFLPLVFANAIIMGLMVLIDSQRWTRSLVFPRVFMAVLGGIAALLLWQVEEIVVFGLLGVEPWAYKYLVASWAWDQ